ncbi:MAG: Rad52/Rad22 family DNA repair protein [Planctomycetota bacterium]
MFYDGVISELSKPLDAGRVLVRSQAGQKLFYIEGWWAIREANRIFGFGNWERETLVMEHVSSEQNDRGTNLIGYRALVKVTVYPDDRNAHSVIRTGSGFGIGASQSLGDAHESGIKGAETDAMKRALVTFGNPFGLSLYGKKKPDVSGDVESDMKLSSSRGASARGNPL